jgi:hypothetical protein
MTFTAEAIKAQLKLTLYAETSCLSVMIAMNSLNDIPARLIKTDSRGISTIRLSRVTVMPIDKPKPGITVFLFRFSLIPGITHSPCQLI